MGAMGIDTDNTHYRDRSFDNYYIAAAVIFFGILGIVKYMENNGPTYQEKIQRYANVPPVVQVDTTNSCTVEEGIQQIVNQPVNYNTVDNVVE